MFLCPGFVPKKIPASCIERVLAPRLEFPKSRSLIEPKIAILSTPECSKKRLSSCKNKASRKVSGISPSSVQESFLSLTFHRMVCKILP